MTRRMLMTDVNGVDVRSKPRLGWMDDVNEANCAAEI